MGRYTNCVCDHCKKAFNDGDDIVICPVCGAPQHRECYNAHHACPHETEHAGGYEWKFPAQGMGAKTACRHCGAQNSAEAKFCQLCGSPLTEEERTFGNRNFDERNFNNERQPENPFAGARTAGNSQGAFTVDEVSSDEIASYVGPSGKRMLSKFRSILEGSRGPGAWSLPAFIFGPFYLLYRKVKNAAYIMMLILVALHIPNFVYMFEYFKAYMAPEMFGITLAYNATLLNAMAQISNVMWFLRFGLHVYCGFTANRFVLNTAIDDICDMHTRYTAEERKTMEYREALFFRGRPTVLRPVLWAVALFALTYAATYSVLVPLIS